MFFDTHVHFAEGDAAATATLVERARAAGVTRLIAVGGSCPLNRAAVEAARAFPEVVRPAVGHDRDRAPELAATAATLTEALDQLRFQIGQLRGLGVAVSAVGEIGLDFHYAPGTRVLQEQLFARQLELARELRLPVIVHSREADAATLSLLAAHRAAWTGDPERLGVLHCFTGSPAFAEALLALGFHLSFSGIVTFPKAGDLRAVARIVPGGRLLIETDTPYLAPVPHRGHRNEPAWVRHVAEVLAETRGVTVEAVAGETAANAGRLFAFAEPVQSAP